MRRAIVAMLLFLSFPGFALASPQAPLRPAHKPDPDRFGMTCPQILGMTSSEWIAKFNDKARIAAPDNASGLARAVAAYGQCYDERTNQLAASLARTGKGPARAARADFATFERALTDFTAKALVDSQPPASEEKKVYAGLREKLFRYEFYQEYEAKSVKTAKPLAPPEAKPSPPSLAPPAPSTTPAAAAAAKAQEQARSDADPMTRAKNQFAALLGALPDDSMHDVHRSFGEVIGRPRLSEAMRLALLRYAIFLLEPPTAKPFSPPPF